MKRIEQSTQQVTMLDQTRERSAAAGHTTQQVASLIKTRERTKHA